MVARRRTLGRKTAIRVATMLPNEKSTKHSSVWEPINDEIAESML
jgi:hypothetical protein